MSKICPKCNKEWPDDFMACPLDGTALIAKPQQPNGFNVNLGDANAVSGGIHMNDQRVFNTTNNVTNNTSTINNINIHKTESEIQHERELDFVQLVRESFINGILDHESIIRLEQERIRIGLDEIIARQLIETVRRTIIEAQHTSLSSTQTFLVDQIKQYIKSNQTEQLARQLPRLEAIVKNSKDEDAQYLYYMSLAAIVPDKLIAEYEEFSADSYWQTYWAYLAYTKQCNFQKAEDILFALPRFTQYPKENITILSAVGTMREFGIQSARELVNTIAGQYSEQLEDFTVAIFCLVEPDSIFHIDIKNSVVEFFLHNLLQFEDVEEQSKLFNLRLVSSGTNSFKVTMILKSELKVTLAEAKAIISCCPIDIIKKKTKKQLDPILKLIKEAGATAEIVDL